MPDTDADCCGDGFYIEGDFWKDKKIVSSLRVFDDLIHVNEFEFRYDFIAEILVNGNKFVSNKYRDIYGCFLWFSRNLDNAPHQFGSYNLEHHKKVKTTMNSVKAEGAEFYVMSHLMLYYGLICSQASRAMPGYDLLVSDPLDEKKIAKIQVKYRSGVKTPNKKRRASLEKTIDVNSLDFDFIILVSDHDLFLEKQCGYVVSKSHDGFSLKKEYGWQSRLIRNYKPSCWVMSKEQIEFGQVKLSDDCYEDWDKISDYFERTP